MRRYSNRGFPSSDSNSWGSTLQRKMQHKLPPHLKGKQIGQFFKDRQQRQQLKKEFRKTQQKEFVITFGLPAAVERRVSTNLDTIAKLAKELEIDIPSVDNLMSFANSYEAEKSLDRNLSEEKIKLDKEALAGTDDFNTWSPNENQESLNMSLDSVDESKIFVKPDAPGSYQDSKPGSSSKIFVKPEAPGGYQDSKPGTSSKMFVKPDAPGGYQDSKPGTSSKIFVKPEAPGGYQDSKPGTSSGLDFIPIGSDDPLQYTKDRLLPLRGGGDYKYGYRDIITGTFEEKLEESLYKNPPINASADSQDISMAIYTEYQNMQTKSAYKKMLNFREMLPAYKKASELLNVINSNQVVVISGETGCGKSTQVPQIILDSAIKNKEGANVHIVVTQPRRIAASSLAARVAAERAEKMGNSVGYAVRLEKVDARPRGSIMFCTTGVLLADLEVNQSLSNDSHIILDEVHERDCHIDMSMCMLKKVLQKRKDLKLILMSATLDAEKLSEYFDGCPMVHIEGLAYPVQDIYLEDILLMTKYELPPEKKPFIPHNKKWKKFTAKGKKFAQMEGQKLEKEIQFHAEIEKPLTELLKNRPEMRAIRNLLLNPRIEDMNVDLILELLIHICKGPPGAILVFLPGIGDITKLLKLMDQCGKFPSSHYEIHPLHSKLPSLEQHKIFERPPVHIRKIIVATNIAETSITIDDIVYVVDCGKIKINGLKVEENLSTLNTEWVSQANLMQRRGRAGRCQAGICYHLLTSYRAAMLQERLLPELQRNDLLEPVLTIKKLRLGNAAEAMAIMPSPPAVSTVEWAVKHLQQCGALNDSETLTPLGWHLARLPVHPAAGKLLLLGSLFGCLDRAASVAAVWGFKDPFQMVIGKEKEVDEAKRNLALGEPSDHVAISEAIIQWENLPQQRRNVFAYKHFLSNYTLELLSDMKRQLGDSLKQMGFLPNGNICSDWENRNAQNLSLFKAIVAAALYPKVATAKWGNLRSAKGRMPRVKAFLPLERNPVAIHPSSVMGIVQKPGTEYVKICDNPGANWLVYWLKQRSTDLYLIEVTLVHTLPVLFFGELSVKADTEAMEEDMCLISTCGVKVRCKNRTTSILFQLRALLDQVLAAKVMSTGQRHRTHCDFEECVLNAVVELITAEDERAVYFGDEDEESDSSERNPSFQPIATSSYASYYY